MAGSSISTVSGLGSASKAVSVTVSTAQNKCKGIYIGTQGDWYFLIDGTEVLFKGCESGTVLPIKATKAGSVSGFASGAPSAGDIVFLY